MRTQGRNLVAWLILVQVATLSCYSLVPAGFWRSYRKAFIANQESDQGPWGGWRWVQWRADQPGTFRESDVRDFAERQGWQCVERFQFAARELVAWQSSHHPIFPLLYPIDHGPAYYA